MKINDPRLLLAKMRKGDYAHAGDVEAIDIVLEKILSFVKNSSSIKSKNKNIHLLDVGSGLGGTAEFIRKKTKWDIYGVDIDNTAIQHSKLNYPKVNADRCDVMDVEKLFKPGQFDVMCMFNAFYAFLNQRDVLQRLANIAREGAILAIFDYTLLGNATEFLLTDLSGRPMKPIVSAELEKHLKETGWEIIEVVDLNEKYQKWYRDFLDILENNKKSILNEFTENAYRRVYDTFSSLLESIIAKRIGGAVFIAKLNMSKLRHQEVTSYL